MVTITIKLGELRADLFNNAALPETIKSMATQGDEL